MAGGMPLAFTQEDCLVRYCVKKRRTKTWRSNEDQVVQ